jgi:hypothetical protein
MTEDPTLIEKREALKRQLTAGDHLGGVVLDRTGHLIQKRGGDSLSQLVDQFIHLDPARRILFPET